MNKKQLSLQNASLFAELERKSKEMEILEIRLQDAEKKIGQLADENENLKVSLEEVNDLNGLLTKQNKELEDALAEAEAKATETSAVINTAEPEATCEEATEADTIEDKTDTEENCEEFFEEYSENNSATVTNEAEPTEFAEEVAEFTEEAEASIEAADELTEDGAASDDIITPAEPPAPPTNEESPALTTEPKTETERSGPVDDLLRDYGARIIGKVTRITAEVLSKISNVNDEVSESLKTLALGKNESFKFQIMELAKRKDDPEKIKAEMDLLADEAIVYLRSI